MKEHFQDYGVRKWAGEDLIDLQAESLAALQGMVEPYAPCVIKGCEVTALADGSYAVAAGLVALKGQDVKGVDCVKIVRFDGLESTVLPIYLTLSCVTLSRVYSDNKSKPIAYDYKADVTTIRPGDDVPCIEITTAGVTRLVDTMGITQKLDSVGGEAKDTVVGFVQAAERVELTSGSRLGVLLGLVKKWFADLKALAFKDKVAKTDLDAALTTEFDNKVDKIAGKGLSTNDFTTALKDKLNGVETGANKYTHPAYTSRAGFTDNMSPSFGGTAYTYTYNVDNIGHVTGVNTRTITMPSATATTSSAGLMSAADKNKVDGNAPFILSNTPLSISNGLPTVPYAANKGALFSNGIAFHTGIVNDAGWIRVLGTTEENTVLEIATGDDGNGPGSSCEVIAARQYGTDNVVHQELELLNKYGNTINRNGGFYEGSYRVYSPNNKPSAADIGAAAASHSHTPSSIGAASSSHSHAWGDITNKPSTFTPSAHSHTPSDCGMPGIITGYISNGSSGDSVFSKEGTGIYKKYGQYCVVVVTPIGDTSARTYAIGSYVYINCVGSFRYIVFNF